MQPDSRRAAFHTLGCKVNQYETEAMKEQFAAAGYTVVGENDPADVYVVNTCTVTSIADRKSRQYIRRMKRNNPEALMVVTGCYAQVSAEDLEKIEEVDMIVGNNLKSTICSRVTEELDQRKGNKYDGPDDDEPEVDVLDYDQITSYESFGIPKHDESVMRRAYIKIQDGCNRFCTYCKIPYARGNIRSRSAEEITEEAGQLVGEGYREIILTGINTALYGYDDKAEAAKGFPLGRLIGMVNDIEGDFRIRLSSLEPNVVDVDDVKSLAGYDKLCHHLHLALQSGSDNVLRRMNRHYTREDYLEIVKALRSFDPLYGITTDLIVGFPGETEEDFEDTLDIVRRSEFGRVHGFKYSPRRGTKAASFEDRVPPEVKNERIKRLINTAEQTANAFNEKNFGVEQRVLAEARDGDKVLGYTDNYIRTYIDDPAHELEIGSLYAVQLTQNCGDGCLAEII